MNLNEFQNLSKRTLPKYNDFEGLEGALANYALGLAGESGEVVDHIKKYVFHGHAAPPRQEIENELGDVLHYLAGLATMFNMDLEDVAQSNLDKLKKRYPDGFSEEASRNRDD